MISTDEGIQIDESDEQSENADASIRETLQSESKRTFERFLQQEKQPQLNPSKKDPIITSQSHPRYNTIHLDSEFMIKHSQTFKYE
jgi:hypothetical protein